MFSKVATSLQTFRSHMKRREEDGSLDASGVISRECYQEWLNTKLANECDDEARKFHRVLTNHVSGVDGRSPFDPEEEQAILVMFRRREPWPCFPPHMADVGRRYRSKGYHEKQQILREKQQRALPPPSAAAGASSFSASSSSSSATASFSSSSPPKFTSSLSSASLSPTTQHASPTTIKPLPQQLKPRSGSTSLSVSLYHSAAQQLQRPIPADNLEDLLGALSLQDRTYVHDLSRTVVTNFASPNFSLEDWRAINTIFRFMVLARTTKAALNLTPQQQLAAARRICESFNQNDDKETVVMVFDPTAKSFAERAIVQNDYSLRTIGPVVNNYDARGVDGSELYSTMLAMGAAFATPGRSFKVTSQKHWCVDGAVHAFDMSYCVDPASLLVALWGKLAPEEEDKPPMDVAAAVAAPLVDDWLGDDDLLLSTLDQFSSNGEEERSLVGLDDVVFGNVGDDVLL